MFIYLSKKIAIPNNAKINCLAWNKDDGYLAVGGEEGLLKVLKLDCGNSYQSIENKGLSPSSNLSMNQTLEGHSEDVRVIIWNESHKKLTSSDKSGIIIVWLMYKGSWYEEMINNRKKSTVVGMDWSVDGLKICIAYEDGAVIVGSVDGNRIWGKELKGKHLSGVQWSPNGKLLLLTTKNSEVLLYDYLGNFIMPVKIFCKQDLSSEIPIVSLDWYSGKKKLKNYCHPVLAICFINGQIQLMVNESDPAPIIINTLMFITHCCWNHNGSLLAISGRQHDTSKEINAVQFYNPFGDHLCTLKVPGTYISCCVWEQKSFRVALAIDSLIYFANVRPDYKWCYFKKTIVFASSICGGICITFWDTTSNHYHTKYVLTLSAIAAYGDYCVLAITRESDLKESKCNLLLCNALGTSVDGKSLIIDIQWLTINSYYVIAASKDNFLLWQYKTPRSFTFTNKCKMYHIDETPSGAIEIVLDLEQPINIPLRTHSTNDPICCITASNKYLIVGRESGILQHYVLPHIALVNKYKLETKPYKISLNCNSSKLSVINISGVLTVLDISEDKSAKICQDEKLERKDVWTMCWASDNPQLLAVMEKTRMYIFKGIHPEEPISSLGYICNFQDLEVQSILLDDIIESYEKPKSHHLVKLEVKSLRDTKQLLEKVGIFETIQFVEDNPHPRLWKLLGEAALKDVNLSVAESAFVHSHNYFGIQLVKKLHTITNKDVKIAYIEAYLNNFEKSEKLFIEADRKDLALNLRQILGDWFRVIQIMKDGVTLSDLFMETVYNSIADYFIHNKNWSAAVEYYNLSKNISGLIKCHYHLENMDALEKLNDKVSKEDKSFVVLSNIFAFNSLIPSAVNSLLKMGDVKSAVDLCISHNDWDQAIHLARVYNLPEIKNIFQAYSDQLVRKNQLFRAIEINKQANFYSTASLHAAKLAYKKLKKSSARLLDIKKLFVYSALLKEFCKSAEESNNKDNYWRGAEACHLLILTYNNLYSGKIHDAVLSAFQLQEYYDIVSYDEIYSILALVSCLNNNFSLCSDSFTKLQTLQNMTENGIKSYENLAAKIFTIHQPTDLKTYTAKCYNCQSLVKIWSTFCKGCSIKFSFCLISGCPLISVTEDVWVCSVCHHVATDAYMAFKISCPLCHSRVKS